MSPHPHPIPFLNTAESHCAMPLPTVSPCLPQLTPPGPLGTPWGPVPSLPLTPPPGRWEAASTPLPSPATALLQTFQLPMKGQMPRTRPPALFSTENDALYSLLMTTLWTCA